MVLRILPMSANSLTARWYTSVLIMYLMVRVKHLGNQTARTTSLLMYMERLSLPENLLFLTLLINTLSCVLHGYLVIKTMLNVGKTHDEVRVVNDQIGTPTYTLDLARLLVDMVETDKYGYYHATNEGGYISWYDFTKEIYAQAGLSTKVTPVTTAEYGISKAARPFNSRLDKSKLTANGFTPLPTWQDALHRFLKEIGEI